MKFSISVLYMLMVVSTEAKKSKKTCSSPCNPGWTQWRDSCYRFYNEPRLNFDDADSYCNQFENRGSECRRGHLVAIDSNDENEFILNWWKTTRPADVGEVYIGFTDAYVEGSWNWSNGVSPTFTNWDEGQPDNGGSGQHCAVMWNRSGDRGLWDDYWCSYKRPFICEIKAI